MLQFQRGSRAAFEELFARYREPLFGFFRRRLDSKERAEDLTQETFLAMIRGISRYEPRALVRTYLYGIALKSLAAERRQQAKTRGSAAAEADCGVEPNCESSLWVRQALDKARSGGAGDSHVAGIRATELRGDCRVDAGAGEHGSFPTLSITDGVKKPTASYGKGTKCPGIATSSTKKRSWHISTAN